jgi:hypothetical protein
MAPAIGLTRQQADDIFKALNGIAELLKVLPARPENASVMYAIMSNISVIQMNLAGSRRFTSS